MEVRSRSAAAPQRGRSPPTASVITRELSVSIKKLFTDHYPLFTCRLAAPTTHTTGRLIQGKTGCCRKKGGWGE